MKEKRGDVKGGKMNIVSVTRRIKPKCLDVHFLKCLFFKHIMAKYYVQMILQTDTSCFFRYSEVGERGRINVNTLVLSIKLIWSSLRLFLTVRVFLNWGR